MIFKAHLNLEEDLFLAMSRILEGNGPQEIAAILHGAKSRTPDPDQKEANTFQIDPISERGCVDVHYCLVHMLYQFVKFRTSRFPLSDCFLQGLQWS